MVKRRQEHWLRRPGTVDDAAAEPAAAEAVSRICGLAGSRNQVLTATAFAQLTRAGEVNCFKVASAADVFKAAAALASVDRAQSISTM